MRVLGLLILLSAAAAMLSCAPTATASKPSVLDEPAKIPEDRVIARLIATGKIDQAQKTADSLMASRDPADREIAAYWRAVCWLYRDQPDSALTVFESYHGKWSGGLRRVHSEVFLHLARDASQAQALIRQHHEDPPKSATDKALQDRVDALQKETVDLRAEIGRLETERLKYQKLIKDLETIR
jgi:hypothetical protein